MKKIILSAIAFMTLGTLNATASDTSTPVFAHASKLKFSGVHYLGFTQKDMREGSATNNFEVRRNYLQVKAYLLENPKSYLRVTLDTEYTAKHDDHADVYAKYAYIYLADVLANTGVEFGMVHRPWIDYEEHQGWLSRSISKVFAEASEAGHLTNSSDLGFNFKTKTPYFTSEVGVFNGEGYHGKNGTTTEDEKANIGDGVSAEWRFTASIMGNGTLKRKAVKDTYFDASFFGQYNMENSANAGETYKIYGLHTVYNMPSFLISAQYIMSENNKKDETDFNGQGYSINGVYRFGQKKEFSIIGRYDNWENENSTSGTVGDVENNMIYGMAWQQNKNIKWLATGQSYYIEGANDSKDYNSAMITAEVHW